MTELPHDRTADGGLTRRSIMRTAAWAIPAVSVAVAVPALAASGAQIISLGSLDFEVADETGAVIVELQGISAASASASLASTTPISFDEDSDGYLAAGTAAVAVSDSVAIFVVRAIAPGATTIVITAGAAQQSFTITFS